MILNEISITETLITETQNEAFSSAEVDFDVAFAEKGGTSSGSSTGSNSGGNGGGKSGTGQEAGGRTKGLGS